MTARKTAPKSQAQLRKEADKIFSIYIRVRDANNEGIVHCYTCTKSAHWKKMQCGHFVPRQYLATRYDPVNCHAQCYACNMLYNGQPSAYAARLEEDYGRGTVKKLEALRTKISRDFNYTEVIEIYKAEAATFEALSTEKV